MKSILTIIAATLLFISCNQKQSIINSTDVPTFDKTKETEAILGVINEETKNFFDGNYEGWAINWSHQPYAMQAWNNSDGTADAAAGWEAINAQGKDWIEKYYKNGENIIHPDYKRSKPLVKFFSPTCAYLQWKQYNADKEKKYYRISTETRLMEKEADGWKIVNVSAFWDVAKKVSADSLKVLNLD